MDDGSCMKDHEGKTTGFRLNSQGFPESHQQLLLHALHQRYSLDVAIWRDRAFRLIGVRSGSIKAFVDLVEPYIVPSFSYKIVLSSLRLSSRDVDLSHPGAAKGPKG
jgi:hypothetical protein